MYNKELVKKYWPEIVLGLAIVIFIAVFSYLSVRRYLTLNSYYYDLGIMNQVVDNTSRGRILEMTNQQLAKNVNRLAIHFDPILAFFAPFYLIWRDPSVLLIGQAAIVGLGALAVYLLAVKVIKRKPVSLLFAVSYLMYFQVQRAVLFDFHAVTLATPFFLFAFYFVFAKKYLPYFIFLFLALLTKEHVGLVVIMLGLYLVFIRKEIKVGLATAGLGAVFFVGTVFFAIPYARQQEHFALKYFEEFGDSPAQIIFNVFAHPAVTLRKILNKESLDYIFRLVSPAFFALVSPFAILIALPEWAINILSINGNMRSYYFHYSSLIVPAMFLGLVLGYKRFDVSVRNKAIKRAAILVFIAINFWSFYLYNPVPGFLVKQPVKYNDVESTKKKTIEFLMDRLKDDRIKLSTTPRLAPFFTNRRYYHNFLFDTAYAEMGQTDEDVIKSKLGSYKGFDYVIIDLEEIGDVDSGKLPVKFYQDLRNNPDYEMILSNDKNIEVYKMKDGNEPLFKDSDI